jgi:tRNA pseudouridine38-40 synthase
VLINVSATQTLACQCLNFTIRFSSVQLAWVVVAPARGYTAMMARWFQTSVGEQVQVYPVKQNQRLEVEVRRPTPQGENRSIYNGVGVHYATMTYWKIVLSYDGTGYYGWQVQPGRPTVQGTLSAALAKMTGEQVMPQGSGRTDAGVHALGQVASFALEGRVPAENLGRALNRCLPPSIRVLFVEEATPDFHARHSALRKSYEYRIFEKKAEAPNQETICSPFLAPYVWDCRWAVDIEQIKRAASLFNGTHDFTSFQASDPDAAQRQVGAAGMNPVKTIFTSEVIREDGLLRYRVTGSGFLHHMVRNIVGTLVEVGRGSLAADEMGRILAARDRTAAGPTAPAQGLFLVRVDYGGAAGVGD